VTIDIAITERGAVVRCEGSLTLERIHEAIAALAAREGFSADLPTVWDFSAGTSGGLSGDDMRALSARVAGFREGPARPRVGIVAPHDSVFGGARMFAGVNADRIQATLRVFRGLEEAKGWVFARDDGADADASQE
jgi:hypothetical protein